MAIDQSTRDWLKRVVLIANQKGGVGKTTVVSGLAVEVARTGRKVLVIDADQQGNLSRRDLGAPADGGLALAKTLQFGEPMQITAGVRPGLDLASGGRHLSAVGMIAAASGGQIDLAANLGTRLAALCAEQRYDLVLIDSGPGDVSMLDALLNVARYLLVPSQQDEASLDGVEFLADRYLNARRGGAAIDLLGAVLFRVDPRATARNADILSDITALLEGTAPPFEATIRDNKAAAIDQRRASLTARELVDELKTARTDRLSKLRKGLKVVRGGEGQLWARDASPLAGDFTRLTHEVLTRLVARETAEAGVAP